MHMKDLITLQYRHDKVSLLAVNYTVRNASALVVYKNEKAALKSVKPEII